MDFLNHLPTSACIVDSTGVIVRVNSACARIGLQAELLPIAFGDHFSCPDAESFQSFLDSIIKSGSATIDCVSNWNTLHSRTFQVLGAQLQDQQFLLQFHITEGAVCSDYQLLIEQYQHNPAGILLVDKDMNMLSFNQEFVKMWGIPDHIQKSRDDEQSLQTVIDQVKDPDGFLKQVQYLYRHQDEVSTDEVWLKDGRCFLRHSYPIRAKDVYSGRAWYFLDISELKQTQIQLDENQKFLEAVLENIHDGIAVCDEQGILSCFNRAAKSMTGSDVLHIPPEQWGRQYGMLHDDGTTPMEMEANPLYRAWNGAKIICEEMVLIDKDGQKRSVQVSGQAMRDSAGKKLGAVVSMHDITDLKDYREQLYQMAHHDLLTGLPNRRLFYQRLRQCLLMADRNKHSVAVMFLDLDNFKEVNDRFGHDSGDTVLVEFAQILRECLRESDIVCRWAGDEFVVVLPEVKREQDVPKVAENICRAVEHHLHRHAQGCRVTVSIGVAMAPQHGNNAEQLVRVADVAMYQAKQAGRNRFYAFPVSTPLPDIALLRRKIKFE